MVSVQEHVTTSVDAAGLIALAAAPVVGLWPELGGWALAPGGVVLLVGAWVADGGLVKAVLRVRRRKAAREAARRAGL